MTEKQFQKRVRWWRVRLGDLGLGHWDFHFEFEAAEGKGRDAEATISVHRTYDSAWWNVPKETLEKSPADIDRVIVHELLHVLFRDWNKVDADMVDTIGGQLGRQFEEALEHELEGVVERLARAITVSATLLDSMDNFTEAS